MRFPWDESFSRILPALALAFGILLGFMGGDLHTVQAQSSDQSWTEPMNLSHSGSAAEPRLVIDSENRVHIIWQDEFLGYVYVTGDGQEWSDPVAVNFPFGETSPELYADTEGQIHALWLDEDGRLFYSRVPAEDFDSPARWLAARQVAESAVVFDLAIDAPDTLHLSYLRSLDTTDFPAGIYYRRSTNNGVSWNNAINLFDSAYYRFVETDNANLDIATGSVGEAAPVYLAWDNQARKRIYLNQSHDGGQTWGEALQIQGPTPEDPAADPFNIRVVASGERVMIFWESRREGLRCTNEYLWSLDAGNTWSVQQTFLNDFVTCSESSLILPVNADLSLLMIEFVGQTYLVAWDGFRWSEPQVQTDLAILLDPETFNPIEIGCRQASVISGGRLVLVGCDNDEGGDIWLTTREIGSTEDWFPPPGVWQPQKNLAFSFPDIYNLRMFADLQNRFHVLWLTPLDASDDNSPAGIYYTRFEAERWLGPTNVLQSPQFGIESFDVTTAATGRIYVVWSTRPNSALYFSWANLDQANSPLNWAEPILLPVPSAAPSAPDIFVTPAGIIYVTYSIPLNENRGVYYLRSDDNGNTWSTPVQIFDAVSAGWESVDEAGLTLTADGKVYALWTRFSLPDGPGSLALYYARSVDGGQTWSEPEEVVEGPILWGEIIGMGDRLVHRIWREAIESRGVLKHQVSLDSGLTWSTSQNITNLGRPDEPFALTVDIGGRLHIVQASEAQEQKFTLQHWLWDGESWRNEDILELDETIISLPRELGAAIAPDGRLGVLVNSQVRTQEMTVPEIGLAFTWRIISLPEALPTPLPTLTPTPQPSPTPTQTPAPSPTPTISFAQGPGTPPPPSSNPLDLSGELVGPVIGGIAAGLLIFLAAVAGLALRRYRRPS